MSSVSSSANIGLIRSIASPKFENIGGFGELVRMNSPVPDQPNTDYSGQVAIILTVNDKGFVISAKSTNGTTHPDQNVIKLVVDHVKKNVKFKAQPGAPIRTAYYTVQIDAG